MKKIIFSLLFSLVAFACFSQAPDPTAGTNIIKAPCPNGTLSCNDFDTCIFIDTNVFDAGSLGTGHITCLIFSDTTKCDTSYTQVIEYNVEIVNISGGALPTPDCSAGQQILKDSTSCYEAQYISNAACDGWDLIDYDSISDFSIDLTLTWKMPFRASYIAEVSNSSLVADYTFEYAPYDASVQKQPVNETNWTLMQSGTNPLLTEYFFPANDTSNIVRLTVTDVCGRTYTAYDEPTFNFTITVNPRSMRENSNISSLKDAFTYIATLPASHKGTWERPWNVHIYDHVVETGNYPSYSTQLGPRLKIYNHGRVDTYNGFFNWFIKQVEYIGAVRSESSGGGWYFHEPTAGVGIFINTGSTALFYNERIVAECTGGCQTIRPNTETSNIEIYDSFVENKGGVLSCGINIARPGGRYIIERNSIRAEAMATNANNSGAFLYGDTGNGQDTLRFAYNQLNFKQNATALPSSNSATININCGTGELSKLIQIYHNVVRAEGTPTCIRYRAATGVDQATTFFSNNTFIMDGLGTRTWNVHFDGGAFGQLHYWGNHFYGGTTGFGGGGTFTIDPSTRIGSNEIH